MEKIEQNLLSSEEVQRLKSREGELLDQIKRIETEAQKKLKPLKQELGGINRRLMKHANAILDS